MRETKPETHTDIKSDGWVSRILPPPARPYALLMRLDRPVGIWLLLLPGWWAIALAAGGGVKFDGFILSRMGLFAAGAVIMRAAGCIVNDVWDRRIDAQIERTRNRPLAAGTIGVRQALALLCVLLVAGLAILLQMTPVTILLGVLTLPLIVLYPLMKRWTWWPQLFLGMTFNFGALMGWSAVGGAVSVSALLLYVGGIFWTLGYDTIYAHQDREDDQMAGIKSSALKLGPNSRIWVARFYAAAMILFIAAFATAGAGALSLAVLCAASLHPAWQLRGWIMDDPESCLRVFKSSRDFGFLVLLAALI